MIGSLTHGLYWRLVLLVSLGALEIYLLVTPIDPIPYFLPWRTVAEKIVVLRHVFLILSIAMNQIGPILFPVDNRTTRDLLVELENVTLAEEEGSSSSLTNAIAPFMSDGKGIGGLKRKLEQLQIEKSLENDPSYLEAAEQFKAKQEEEIS